MADNKEVLDWLTQAMRMIEDEIKFKQGMLAAYSRMMNAWDPSLMEVKNG